MAIFGLYFTKNMLRLSGWPRKQGLLKKDVIDTTIFDEITDQMVDWAAALGAGSPKIALHILAYIFRDSDWEGNDAPKLKMFIDEVNKQYAQDGIDLAKVAPHDVIKPIRLAKHFGSTIKAEAILDKRIQSRLEQDFFEGLVYGLSHPNEFEAWYKHHINEHEMKKELYQKMDLGIDKLPTLQETYKDSKEVIRNYVSEMEIKLPPIPAKLLTDARTVGVKI